MIFALATIFAAATSSMAQAVEVTGRQDAGKVFPHIEIFLKMAAAGPSDFVVAYYVRRDGQPAGDVNATLFDGERQIALPVAVDGRMMRLPTLEQVRNHDSVAFDGPQSSRLTVRIGLAPTAPPTPIMGAAIVEKAIWQANTAIHRLAGPFAVVVPRLRTAVFEGAEGGTALLSDGTSAPLPIRKGDPYYEPSTLRNAVTLSFTKAAQHIDIGP